MTWERRRPMHPQPCITEDEFGVMAKHTGLDLGPMRRQEMYAAYAHLEAMLGYVRKARAVCIEPSNVFLVPGTSINADL